MSQFESQFEEDLYAARLEKLERIADLSATSAAARMEAKYPNHFAFTTDIPTIKQRFEPLSPEELETQKPPVAIAGRLVAIRLQGKAGFATLQQGGQRLQIYVRKDNVGMGAPDGRPLPVGVLAPAFELYKLLDLGDHIGVEGYLFRTRTNELTVHAEKLTFLAKALLPLPDKFSGLGDIELRYRRRYLDLFTDTGDFAEASGYPEASKYPEASGYPEASKYPEASGYPKASGYPEASGHPEASGYPEASGHPEASGYPEASGHPEASGYPEASALGLMAPPNETGALAPEGQPLTPQLTRLPAREVFVKRAAILRSIRNFFDTRGYLEVETPMLHTVAGGAAARPFTTHHNALDIPLSLRIAPELYLKRLVVGGLDRVYEINRNFRNEGVSTSHNPEFTMLEFYQAYANYEQLMTLTQDLITTVAKEVNGTTITNFNGTEIDLSQWTKLSMRDAIRKWWRKDICSSPSIDDFDSNDKMNSLITSGLSKTLLEMDRMKAPFTRDGITLIGLNNPIMIELEPLQQFHTALNRARQSIETNVPFGRVIAELFEALAEPHLIQPTIIYDFPLAVSPLSKIKPNEPEWTERFEFYIGGFEVGNAFSELNDPVDQRNRFAAQVADKDPESMAEIDEDYVRALGYGLPPTAGEGVGIDRLTMILTGSRSIRDVILFPLMRPPKPTLEHEAEAPHGESAE